MIQSSAFEDIYTLVLGQIQNFPTFVGEARGEKFKEVVGLTFNLTDPRNRLVWNEARNTNYEFAMKLFLWIQNGCNDAEYLTGINPNSKAYLDDLKEDEKATFDTAYGPRIVSQIDSVVNELIRDENSRRGTVMILCPEDAKIRDAAGETKVEYPCTESLTFFIRNGKLHCHVNMRSNNMVTTVVYDVFVFTMLQEWVLKKLNWTLRQVKNSFNKQYDLGEYVHHCTSAHYFVSQESLVEKILASAKPSLNRHDKRVEKEQELKEVEVEITVQDLLRGGDPWRFFVGCVLVNRATGKAVKEVMKHLFHVFPDREALVRADETELVSILRPLGFQNSRAETLIKMSEWFIEGGYHQGYIFSDDEIMSCPGLGKYARDSYRAFVLRDKNLEHYQEPIDKVVRMQIEYLLEST